MSQWITLIFMAFALSMDAFAVSICNGMSIGGIKKGQGAFIAGFFGLFQGVMPILGYFLGELLVSNIKDYLPYISFAILLIIGGKMIFEGISTLRKPEEAISKKFNPGQVLVQGIATSIDALAVGVSLLSFSINIWISAAMIAVITFAMCLLGVFIGVKAGTAMKGKNGIADIIGGAVLVLIAINFLIPW